MFVHRKKKDSREHESIMWLKKRSIVLVILMAKQTIEREKNYRK